MVATKKRLIDANGKYTINAVDLTGFILCFSDGIISVVDRFGHVACEFYADDIPAVDAVEVVHGHWFWAEDAYIYCSECKQKAPVIPQYQNEPMTSMTKYCPHCGAKMDGVSDG